MTYLSALGFVSGMITAGYSILGLLLLRFWRRTHDSLFSTLAVSFWLLAANQAVVTFFGRDEPQLGWAYLLRLAAFLLIIVAIVRKNTRVWPNR